jgi:hypothetical protein
MRMASSLRGALGGRGAPGGCGLESGDTRTSMPFNDTGLVPICRLLVSDRQVTRSPFLSLSTWWFVYLLLNADQTG